MNINKNKINYAALILIFILLVSCAGGGNQPGTNSAAVSTVIPSGDGRPLSSIPESDTGRDLPAGLVYPQGRIFPILGYNGNFAREKANSFTVGGIMFGNIPLQKDKMAAANAVGLPYVYPVGFDLAPRGYGEDSPGQMATSYDTATKQYLYRVSFPPDTTTYWYTEQQVWDTVASQVREVSGLDPEQLCWWSVRPEELKPYRVAEMRYLQIVTDAIRANDPYNRPVYMYYPHSFYDRMVTLGKYVDFINHGNYVNELGYEDNRAFVIWGMEQEALAASALAGDGRVHTPVFMPTIYDPKNPANDVLAPAYMRHDIYLALALGAKGVNIYPLYKHAGNKRTFDISMETLSSIAYELNGPLHLGEVCLFGEKYENLSITQAGGPETITMQLDLDRSTHTYAALNHRTIAFQGRVYIFAVNSTLETVSFMLDNIPEDFIIESVLGSDENCAEPVRLTPGANGKYMVSLDKWGAVCLRISPH